MLPQPPAMKVEEDDNPVFDLAATDPIGLSDERAGIHLVEPPASVKGAEEVLAVVYGIIARCATG